MLWVGRLIARYEGPKLGFMQPFGQKPPQPPLPFGRIEMIGAMECVPGVGGFAFAGYHQNGAETLTVRIPQKSQEFNASHFGSPSVQIHAPVNLDIAAGQLLRCAAVQTGYRRRRQGCLPPHTSLRRRDRMNGLHGLKLFWSFCAAGLTLAKRIYGPGELGPQIEVVRFSVHWAPRS